MKDAFNIPNLLTYLRMLMIPFFVAVFVIYPNDLYIALSIYIVASITDIVDGYIARKYNMVSKIGKVLDPLADKLLKITALICFVYIQVLPIWLLVSMIVIDLTMVITAGIWFNKDIVIKSNVFGKLTTFVITVGIVIAFFHNYVNGAYLYVLYAGLILYLISIISYISTYLKVKNKAVTN